MAKKKIQNDKVYEFDIAKIVEFLRPYSIKLNELYKWKFKIESLIELNMFSKSEIDTLNIENIFEREIKLKILISKKINELKLKNDSNFYVLANWIIDKWGGIKSSIPNNDIEEFLNSERPIFKRIASTSKVGSFLYPQKHIIYDSRVAYSLNWIILSQSAGEYFFPIPSGRNSKMCSFDINVLIRLSNITNYIPNKFEELENKKFISNRDLRKYIPQKDSYFHLRNLIKEVNIKLWDGDKEKEDNLYYTEMLLFSIADKQVYLDIVNKTKVIFN